jgi:transcriptional regulator
VIFQGPHTYITPSWYEPIAPSVPTWNYATVHAYGVPKVVEEHDALRAMLGRLVDTHEAGFERPWRLNAPDDYMDRMLRAIVGFEIEITRLEGKFKLSQNRPAADQRHVADMLAQSEHALDVGVAELMMRDER